MARNPIGILAPQFAQGALSAAAARGQQTAAENARIAAQRAEIAARERIAAQQAFIDMQRVKLGYAEMEARNRLAQQQNQLEEKRLSQQERLALNAEKNTTERFLANLEEQKTSRISSEAIAKAQLGLQRGQFDIMAAKERRLFRALDARKKYVEAVREHGEGSEQARAAEADLAMVDDKAYDQFYRRNVLYPESGLKNFTANDVGTMPYALHLAQGDERRAEATVRRDNTLRENFYGAKAAAEMLMAEGMPDLGTLERYKAQWAQSHAVWNQRLKQLGFSEVDMQGIPIEGGDSKGSGRKTTGNYIDERNQKRYAPDAEPFSIPYAPSTSDPNEGAFWRKLGSEYGSVPAVPTGIPKYSSPWTATATVPNLNITPSDAPGPMFNTLTNPVQISSARTNLTSPAAPVIQYDPQTGQLKTNQ